MKDFAGFQLALSNNVPPSGSNTGGIFLLGYIANLQKCSEEELNWVGEAGKDWKKRVSVEANPKKLG